MEHVLRFDDAGSSPFTDHAIRARIERCNPSEMAETLGSTKLMSCPPDANGNPADSIACFEVPNLFTTNGSTFARIRSCGLGRALETVAISPRILRR
jgi:hypothetical protein